MSVPTTPATSSLLNQIRENKEKGDKHWERLTAGKKSSTPVGNPEAFHQEKALVSRASDVMAQKVNIDQSIMALNTAAVSSQSINAMLENMKGIIEQARNASSPADRARFGEILETNIKAIQGIAQDTSYQGMNTLNSQTTLADIEMNTPLPALGDMLNSLSLSGLGLQPLSTYADNTSFNQAADQAIAALNNTISEVKAYTSSMSNIISVLSIRSDFSTNYANTLTNGATSLGSVDATEEAVSALVSGIRNGFGTKSLAVAQQSEKNILRLFEKRDS